MEATQLVLPNPIWVSWHRASNEHVPVVREVGLLVELAINHFYSSACMDFMGYLVSQNLHFRSVKRVLYAPMSFFDTTVSLVMLCSPWRPLTHATSQPLGRILGVFGKDVDSESLFFQP